MNKCVCDECYRMIHDDLIKPLQFNETYFLSTDDQEQIPFIF